MIGIIGAMEDEVTVLESQMKQVHSETIGGFNFIAGSLEEKPVCLLKCGIGKVNAAVGCTLLIHIYKPALVINTGSAGGIAPHLHCGDTVIADAVVYHDVDVTAFDYAPGQVPSMPALFPIADNLVVQAEQAVDELKKEQMLPESFYHIRGLIGSGDIFMHEPYRIAIVRSHFPAIQAVEMEAAAVAHVCFLWSVPVMVIRSLSDVAGNESPVTFNDFLPVASKHSALIVHRIIKNWPGSQH
jgi:adenosylhomocysteine nucleosidase